MERKSFTFREFSIPKSKFNKRIRSMKGTNYIVLELKKLELVSIMSMVPVYYYIAKHRDTKEERLCGIYCGYKGYMARWWIINDKGGDDKIETISTVKRRGMSVLHPVL